MENERGTFSHGNNNIAKPCGLSFFIIHRIVGHEHLYQSKISNISMHS